MKIKKVLILVFSVLIIIFCTLVVREVIISNDGKLDKSNVLTRDEIIALLEKGANYNNYYYCPDFSKNETKTEYYVKDNIVVCYINSELTIWTDFNEKESIHIWDIGKYKKIASITKDVNLLKDSQAGYDYSLVTDIENYNYEYLGEKEDNNRQIVIIKISYKGSNGYTKFYIDKETGLISSRKDITKTMLISTHINKTNRNLKIDIVTDSDIKKPDLTMYEVRDSN